jgi:hypothetical protein
MISMVPSAVTSADWTVGTICNNTVRPVRSPMIPISPVTASIGTTTVNSLPVPSTAVGRETQRRAIPSWLMIQKTIPVSDVKPRPRRVIV